MGESTVEPKGKLRWYQFHLRHLFVLTTLVGVVMGSIVAWNNYRRGKPTPPRPLSVILSRYATPGGEIIEQPTKFTDPCLLGIPIVSHVGEAGSGSFKYPSKPKVRFSYPAVEGTYIEVYPIKDADGNIHLLAIRRKAKKRQDFQVP